MPVRYDRDTRANAIRLVREHAGGYPSEYAAITAVARRLGMSPETLRTWSRTLWKAGLVGVRHDGGAARCRRRAGCPACQWEDIAAGVAAIDLEFPVRSPAGVAGESSLAAADAPAGTQAARAGLASAQPDKQWPGWPQSAGPAGKPPPS